MMRLIGIVCTSCIWAISSVPVLAGPILVELYTSQGCSSCPPADRFLTELAKQDDVIALGMHVDYWDYIGWKDEFAIAEFTPRQAAYNMRLMSPYRLVTPQIILHGVAQYAGGRIRGVPDKIESLRRQPEPVEFVVKREGDRLTIRLEPKEHGREICKASCSIYLAEITPEATIKIERGENRGRTILYTNVVDSWKRAATWNGQEKKQLSGQVDPSAVLVAVLQEGRTGPILAARQVE